MDKGCTDFGLYLGTCGSATSDGDCKDGGQAVWECIDMGPVNCWAEVEACAGTSVCWDPIFGAATCIDDGHADFCKAWKDAGSGCLHGESDCDSDGECLGSLVCVGPIIVGQDGCCNEGEGWDGEVCSGQAPEEPVCPGGCLDIGEVSDSFEHPFVGNQSANGLWEKQVGAWYCTLDGGQVDNEDGDLVIGVTAGGVACGQVDSGTSDFYYGSYRASMKTSSVPGTCASLFFYGEDGISEVDIEILSNEDGEHTVHFVVHPSGGLPCGSANHKCVDMAVAPSSGFHEYGFDILPGEAKFFIDGAEVASIDSFIPEAPGGMIINHWAGNPNWTGAPPAQAAELLVEWFEYTPAGLCNVCGQCGNDIVNEDEDCDGPFLNGATCASLGYGGGDLICTGCAFNASGCDTEPSCGDGVCNSEEDCGICPETWSCNETGVCVPGGVPGEDTTGGDTIPWDPNWQVESDGGAKSGGCAAAPTGSVAAGMVLVLLGLAALRRRARA